MNFSFRYLSTVILILAFWSLSAQKTHTVGTTRVKSYTFDELAPLLNQKTDSTYVINFWATWCAPCVAELPHFERLRSEYASQKIKVILVSMDFSKQIEKSLIPFLDRKKLQSQVVHLNDPDANAWISKVNRDWSGAIPATLIYNGKTGNRKFFEQSFTYEQLKTAIQTFIPQS